MTKSYLIEEAVKKGLGTLSPDGALMVDTGAFTGRSPKSRYIVRRPEVEEKIAWGPSNQPISLEFSHQLFERLEKKLDGEETYESKGYAGCFPIEVKSNSPWHAAFATNMFREAPVGDLAESLKDKETIRVYHDPYGTVSGLDLQFPQETVVVLDMAEYRIAVIGTVYAGEIKKAAFTLCNFWFPESGILPMHSSANCLEDGGSSSVLFGLSGTGKTTLSATPERSLIGDDEILWSPRGLSNIEGGCYAKLIDLDPEKEPEIYKASNKFGAILENVVFDESTRKVDFSSSKKTENTRGSYDISALSNVFGQNKEAAPPKTIVFLTADAFGAMPIVAKLNPWQAQYHFVSGYTSKVAGTELGVTEPEATFSACFGGPFMPRHITDYSELLASLVEEYDASVWLLNTGWQGGYGRGERYPIWLSRKILSAIQDGSLENQPRVTHPVFGFEVPKSYPGVEDHWFAIPEGSQVFDLAKKFTDNAIKIGLDSKAGIVSKGGPQMKVSEGASSSPMM